MVPGRGGWGVFWQAERRAKDKVKVEIKIKTDCTVALAYGEVVAGMFFMVVD